jgi:hypothetical protein
LEKDGDSFEAEGLHHDWSVMLRTNAKLKNLDRVALVEVFREYESEVTEELGTIPLSDLTYHRGIGPTLDMFGVISAHPTESEGDGDSIVWLFQKNPGSSSDASSITELAVEKAELKAQSLSGRSGERHLAVLVNIDEPTGAGFALSNTELPNDVPTLPSEITDLWMSSIRTLIWHFQQGADKWRLVEMES